MRHGGRRTFRKVALAGLAASVLIPLMGVGTATAQPEHDHSSHSHDHGKPEENPSKGLHFGGLKKDAQGACGDTAFELDGVGECTHGPDPAPEGVDARQSRAPEKPEQAGGKKATAPSGTETTAGAGGTVYCTGDGTSGNRVQAVYARSSDRTDRYWTYASSFPVWAARADAVYANSAAKTGGERHIRYVTYDTGEGCALSVAKVTMPTWADDNFSNTVSYLRSIGYNRTDRKYMVWVDANVYCGIGTIKNDDSASSSNLNNGGNTFGRTDAGCWGLTNSVEAHELMHNLGGVQLSAPHSSGGWHCTDEYDRMCYSDSPYYPSMSYPCASSQEALFDCGNNDYFHTNPPSGSYLATHWNSANNQFLVKCGWYYFWGSWFYLCS